MDHLGGEWAKVQCTMQAATALAVCARAQAPSTAPAQYPLYNEPYRPQYHFAPPTHFRSDPGGLVYFNGWHLYYDYNPIELVARHQSSGHAVSTDLLHWTNLPISIPGKPTRQIFMGSAVVFGGEEARARGFNWVHQVL